MGSPVLWSLRPTRQGALHGTEVRAKSSVLLYHIIFILYLIAGGMENGTDIGAQTSFPTSVKRVIHPVQSTFTVLIQTKNLIILSHQLLRWQPHHYQKQQQQSHQYLPHLRVLPSHFQLPLGWDFLYHDQQVVSPSSIITPCNLSLFLY